jgi:hypothetical protein
MPKPRVTTRCVANQYTGPNERTVEFSSRAGGGLIALRDTSDGRLLVNVYRTDSTVDVTTPTSGFEADMLALLRTLHRDMVSAGAVGQPVKSIRDLLQRIEDGRRTAPKPPREV